MGSIGGQASGAAQSGALRILYSLVKDTIPSLSADAFTQSNPSIVTGYPSTTLPVNVKKGVLGGSVAFTRPDEGSNAVGGPVLVEGSYLLGAKPVGLFINDALGNAYENTPAVASGKGPFLRGGSVGVKIYETQRQTNNGAGSAGDDLSWAVGDYVYASVNGLLTNRFEDSYEYAAVNEAGTGSNSGSAIEPDCTRMGIVLAPPDATSAEMFVLLKF
jgi:hypothetical protein